MSLIIESVPLHAIRSTLSPFLWSLSPILSLRPLGNCPELQCPITNPLFDLTDFSVEDTNVALPTDEVEGSGSEDSGSCRGDATFKCRLSGKTICDEMRCDGTSQCPDGEDEEGCGKCLRSSLIDHSQRSPPYHRSF